MKTNRTISTLLACLAGAWLLSSQATAGTLIGTEAPAPASVNLTVQGTLDWAHWGLNTKTDFDHKSGGTNKISDVTITGTESQFADATTGYSWSDGTPTLNAVFTTTGIYVPGLSKVSSKTNGFQFTVAADATTKVLKVYAGAYQAQVHFEARLSDGSAAPYVNESLDDFGASSSAVYTISYAANSAGQTLTIRVYSIALHDPSGNCTLMSASLDRPPGAGTLNGSSTFQANGAVVNLTSEGTLDWAHWGLATATDFNHKAAVSQKISNYSPIGAGTVTQLGANTAAYTWTDGTPTLNSSNTSAISVAGAGNGFQFIVPADTTNRLLRVYVSAYSARVNFEAVLSDGSAPVLSDASFDATPNQQGPVHVYVVQYAATSASQTLTVKCSVFLDEGAGSVSLQAANLQLFPAQTGAIAGGYSVLSIAVAVDLTDEGKIDWAHWGITDPTSLDRKIGGTNVISDFSVIGLDQTGGPLEVQQFGDNLTGYSWNNGTPTATAVNTTTGIWVAQPGVTAGPGLNSGFEVSVPADTTVRALKMYIGAYGARVHFEASLSDGSAPSFVDESYFNPGDGPNRVYTLTFAAASPGQKLIVRWWLSSLSDTVFGNCTLLSAVLRDAAPIVTLVTPANDSIFNPASGGLSFTASTIAPFSIAPTGVGLALNGVNLSSSLVVSGTPTARSASFTNLVSNRFYQGQIYAVDNLGRGTTNFVNFDTFTTNGVVVIEAEDYNHDAGQFIDNPAPGDYTGLAGMPEVDYHTISTFVNDYRPSDPLEIEDSPETRGYFIAAGTNNHQILSLNPDDWQNYTRTFPNGTYNVYLRYNAQLPQTVQLDLVTGDRTQLNQTVAPIGSFTTPPLVTDVPRSYAALTNGDGSLISVFLSGVQTLRLTAGTNVINDTYSGLKEDFFMLVPSAAQQPRLTISRSGGQVTVSFPTQTGLSYTVQYKNLLTDPIWQSISPSVIGDGSVKSVSQLAGQPSRFYRVSVQ